MKEKLLSALGSVGIVLYYLATLLVSVLPFVMIDVAFILKLVLIAISTIFPATSVIFWVWGLIGAINGPQDFIAIIYYVLFVVMFLPFFISTISSLFRKSR